MDTNTLSNQLISGAVSVGSWNIFLFIRRHGTTE